MRIDANIRECRRAHSVNRMAIGIFDVSPSSMCVCVYAIFFAKNLIHCRLTVVIHLHRYNIDSMCRYRVANIILGAVENVHMAKKLTVNYMLL